MSLKAFVASWKFPGVLVVQGAESTPVSLKAFVASWKFPGVLVVQGAESTPVSLKAFVAALAAKQTP